MRGGASGRSSCSVRRESRRDSGSSSARCIGTSTPATLPFELRFRELQPETAATVGGVTIRAVRVPHQVEDTALALVVESGGKRVLYSGDSPWFDRFVELARGVDLFLCECTAYDDPMGRHIEFRTLRPRLAELECRRLVLMHLGREMREHAAEMPVECATEGMTIRL